MEQHLQLLATGQPILKPVYDHDTGPLTRPQLVEPRDYIIVEGLLPLSTKLSRACFDVSVYLTRRRRSGGSGRCERDVGKRGYTRGAGAGRAGAPGGRSRRRSSGRSGRHADIVVRFAPIASRNDPPGTPLSTELLLRPTIRHPSLSHVLSEAATTRPCT